MREGEGGAAMDRKTLYGIAIAVVVVVLIIVLFT